MDIILASASKRRQELLSRLTKNFKIIKSNFDESSVVFDGDFSNYAIKLAKGKAEKVFCKIHKKCIVIGCDTIVAYDGKVLGKPKNQEEAFNMLKMLSGRCHKVYTGLCIINGYSNNTLCDYVCTDVKFDSLSDEEIINYIKTGEPMDKAGSYGIQGIGGTFIKEINGCYYNVVGLPLNKLNNMFKIMGVNLI